jgi:hypothetical protein
MEEYGSYDNGKDKKGHKRSAAYPILPINEAYEFAVKINDNFSINNSITRAEIAHVLDFTENTISRDVAACVQYGFLSKTPSEGYKLTKLFDDINRPENEKERKLKLITAFGSPKLFQDLIAKFDNHVIPLEFANTLIKHHGITYNASKSAAEIFIESGVYVGVINEQRVLKYSVTLSAISKASQYAEVIEEIPNHTDRQENLTGSNLSIQIPIVPEKPLSKNNKQIPIYLTNDNISYFIYPSDITEDDIQIIEHEIKGILLRIQLEKKRPNPSLNKESHQ